MIDLPALVLSLFLLLDGSQAEPNQVPKNLDVPPNVEITVQENMRIPWAAKTYNVGSAPVIVEPFQIEAAQAAADLEPEPKALREKNRIPNPMPPELNEIERLKALLLPPSDRVQVFNPGLFESRAPNKSVTTGTGSTAINSNASNSVPPDPEMAASAGHVIAVVNSDYQIFSATNGIAFNNATNLSSLMNSNSDCTGLFDPNVVYDEEYERFIIGADAGGSDYCMAVSLTSDPTGSWAIYSFAADIGGFFFDFPHAGVGLEALYVGSNQFFDSNGNGSLSYQESRVFAVDKVAMYNLQSPTVVSWSLSGFGNSFTPQPLNLHGYDNGTWPTSGPDYFITDQFDSRDVNVWTVEDPFGTGTLTRQSKLDLETYTGVAAGQVVDPPQITGDTLDAGDFRVLDFEYSDGYGWTVQNVSCNPGSGTVNCVRWAQIDLEANTIADAGVFSVDGEYTLHPDLAANRCNDMIVGFSLSSTSRHPAAWVAGRESDDAAGTLSFSQVQQAGATNYVAFDGEPLRWGDYTGATVGPDGQSLWYLGQWSASISGRPSNWSTHFQEYTFPDSDNDDVPDSCDACPGSNDADDADDDTVPDGCDICSGSDDLVDSDDDTVPDGCDICSGFDDSVDSDNDGVPDGCDQCEGDDAGGDTDNDGYCDDIDICQLGDDDLDADADGVPDACDLCEGDDATGNADGDAYCNEIDICSLGDDDLDADADGVPDACDACEGDDASGNADGDGYCTDIDICLLGDDDLDADADGVPDACDACDGDDASGNADGDGFCDDIDICFGADNVDADSDGVCDSQDLCEGDDATGDVDGDMRCADLDCNDNNGAVQDPDRCNVCEGDGTSCVVLFPISDRFNIASTTYADQTEPSIAAGPDGFLVTWTSDDSDIGDVRGRLFDSSGAADGDDFQINQTTAGTQGDSAVSSVGGGDFVVAWRADNFDGNATGIAGRFVDGASATGNEFVVNSTTADNQLYPSVTATDTGFQVVWESFGFDAGGIGVAERRFQADGTPVANDNALTGTGDQTLPDIASSGSGAIVTWAADSSGAYSQLLDSNGSPSGSEVQIGSSAQSTAVAADSMGRALVAWADPDGDATNDGAVFARPVGSDGQPTGSSFKVSSGLSGDQAAPDVAALSGGGFLVVYAEQNNDEIKAQLYESDGSAATVVPGALVGSEPFAVNTYTPADTSEPAVAVDENGTFFVVWTDSRIDGSGTGIAGRLFGTDADNDDLPGADDNCPLVANADQADADLDGNGDACDTCAGFDDNVDADGDATADGCDTCTDTDNDGAGDPGFNANTCATDNCPDDANADQADADLDGTGDVCDTCTDTDGDGLGNSGFSANTCAADNCPDDANADQADADGDGAGDVCDTCTDTDGDGFGNPDFAGNTCATDNCPDDANADQADADEDGIGDACDLCTGDDSSGDGDSDGVCADQDCDDGNPNAQTVDGCGVCGGSNACALFADDFESGNTSAWSSASP